MRTSLAGLFLCAGLGVMGCSGSEPLAPSASASESAEPTLDLAPRGESGLLGAVHVEIDPANATARVDEVRMNQAIGDAFLVGLNDIDHLCNCFQVRSVATDPVPDGLRVTLQVAFNHPFTATARPDLNGWDLKAIVATDANAQSFATPGVSASTGLIRDPDGYTGEWSDQIALAHPGLTANHFPYIILGEDPTVSDPFDFQNPSGWNVFPAGGSNTGTLVIDLPSASSFGLELFFTVGYQASATRTTRQTPDYQPPRGNSRSPWKLEATVTEDELTTEVGSAAELDIRIWDWQHGQSFGSDVTSVCVYAPALMAAPLTPPITSGSGRDTDPVLAPATLTNELGTALAGTTWALVEAIDELNGNNPGGAVGNPGMTRIADDFFSPLPYDAIRTFHLVPLTVSGVATSDLALQLEDPFDFVKPDETTTEWGAALVETTSGKVGVHFIGNNELSPGSYLSRSYFSEDLAGTWTPITSEILNVSSGYDWSWHLKTAPSWLTDESFGVGTLSTHNNGGVEETLTFSAAYMSEPFDARWGHPCLTRYGVEIACSPLDGSVYVFSDRQSDFDPSSRELQCWKGGPSAIDQPTLIWYQEPNRVFPVTVDARPSEVSHSRSAGTTATNALQVAYRSKDGTQLRHALDGNGDNADWAVTDVATGEVSEWGDPAFDLDGDGGAYIAALQFADGLYTITLFASANEGTTWGTGSAVGAPFATSPTDLQLIVRPDILAHQILAIGYVLNGQALLRWSHDGGASWQDDPLSPGTGEYSADIWIKRTENAFYCAYTDQDAGGRDNVMARRGTFIEI